jgi:hypothetical protein
MCMSLWEVACRCAYVVVEWSERVRCIKVDLALRFVVKVVGWLNVVR